MPKPASKLVIAVDIDDVLAANAAGFVGYSNQKWGTNLQPDDYDEHWAQMWGVDHEETMRRRQNMIEAKLFTTYEFLDDAKPALYELSKHYDLVIVSSRTRDIYEDTLEWINRYFGNLIKEIHLAGIWDDLDKPISDKVKVTKTEVAKQIGANYLIDDQPKHCMAAAAAGITAVLFGDYSWNKDAKLLPNMVRAKSWQEVLEYFNYEPAG